MTLQSVGILLHHPYTFAKISSSVQTLSHRFRPIYIMKPKCTKDGYPVIAWTADNKRLIHELLNVLQENDSIRRDIWPRKGETISGQVKAIHRKNIAKKLFNAEPEIKDLLADPKALPHYGIAIKNQLARLERTWKNAKETLGIIGASLPSEEYILDGPNELRIRWNDVKQTCPWFFKMRDMVEHRIDDTGGTITNSETDVFLDATHSGSRRRRDEESDMEDGLDDSGDEDAEIEAVDQRESSPRSTNQTSTTAALRAVSTAPSQASSASFTTGSPSRVFSELTEVMRDIRAANNERKRLRDEGMEETKRIEIRQREETEKLRLDWEGRLEERRLELEKRRLQLEGRRIEMEERSLALEERKLQLQQIQMGHAILNPSPPPPPGVSNKSK